MASIQKISIIKDDAKTTTGTTVTSGKTQSPASKNPGNKFGLTDKDSLSLMDMNSEEIEAVLVVPDEHESGSISDRSGQASEDKSSCTVDSFCSDTNEVNTAKKTSRIISSTVQDVNKRMDSFGINEAEIKLKCKDKEKTLINKNIPQVHRSVNSGSNSKTEAEKIVREDEPDIEEITYTFKTKCSQLYDSEDEPESDEESVEYIVNETQEKEVDTSDAEGSLEDQEELENEANFHKREDIISHGALRNVSTILKLQKNITEEAKIDSLSDEYGTQRIGPEQNGDGVCQSNIDQNHCSTSVDGDDSVTQVSLGSRPVNQAQLHGNLIRTDQVQRKLERNQELEVNHVVENLNRVINVHFKGNDGSDYDNEADEESFESTSESEYSGFDVEYESEREESKFTKKIFNPKNINQNNEVGDSSIIDETSEQPGHVVNEIDGPENEEDDIEVVEVDDAVIESAVVSSEDEAFDERSFNDDNVGSIADEIAAAENDEEDDGFEDSDEDQRSITDVFRMDNLYEKDVNIETLTELQIMKRYSKHPIIKEYQTARNFLENVVFEQDEVIYNAELDRSPSIEMESIELSVRSKEKEPRRLSDSTDSVLVDISDYDSDDNPVPKHIRSTKLGKCHMNSKSPLSSPRISTAGTSPTNTSSAGTSAAGSSASGSSIASNGRSNAAHGFKQTGYSKSKVGHSCVFTFYCTIHFHFL